jgi:ABC-type multidrug transport system fused ATPase/permease subunit
LILDEATSALDIKNENLIQNSLNNINKEIGLITVAHKIQTIINYDKIFVVIEGKIH